MWSATSVLVIGFSLCSSSVSRNGRWWAATYSAISRSVCSRRLRLCTSQVARRYCSNAIRCSGESFPSLRTDAQYRWYASLTRSSKSKGRSTSTM